MDIQIIHVQLPDDVLAKLKQGQPPAASLNLGEERKLCDHVFTLHVHPDGALRWAKQESELVSAPLFPLAVLPPRDPGDEQLLLDRSFAAGLQFWHRALEQLPQYSLAQIRKVVPVFGREKLPSPAPANQIARVWVGAALCVGDRHA